MAPVTVTLVGGPTVLIEAGGFRFLTDPTFDHPRAYELPHVTLTKTGDPALDAQAIGVVDAVLLSHDQHADNLDLAGRAFLADVPMVLSTEVAAGRLELATARGLAPWTSVRLTKPDGAAATVTATPARHGPAGIEPFSGDVTGFLLMFEDDSTLAIYVTGDTVWFEGVAEVARRFEPAIVMPFAGAAQTRGPFHLTMNTNDVVETAHSFAGAAIVPVHTEGWAHFTQSGSDIERTFTALGIQDRLRLLAPGVPTVIEPPGFRTR